MKNNYNRRATTEGIWKAERNSKTHIASITPYDDELLMLHATANPPFFSTFFFFLQKGPRQERH